MTYAATTDQMYVLAEVLNALTQNKEGFNVLSRHGTFMYVSIDDECLSVEWVFDRARIAIDIERDIDESGWSFSSTREAGNYSEGGYIKKDDIQSVAGEIYFLLWNQRDNLDNEVKNGKDDKN